MQAEQALFDRWRDSDHPEIRSFDRHGAVFGAELELFRGARLDHVVATLAQREIGAGRRGLLGHGQHRCERLAQVGDAQDLALEHHRHGDAQARRAAVFHHGQHGLVFLQCALQQAELAVAEGLGIGIAGVEIRAVELDRLGSRYRCLDHFGGRCGVRRAQRVFQCHASAQGAGAVEQFSDEGLDRLGDLGARFAGRDFEAAGGKPLPAAPRHPQGDQHQQARDDRNDRPGLQRFEIDSNLHVSPWMGAGLSRARQRTPVWPKPPTPRSLCSNCSTTRKLARTTGIRTNCAMRSPGCTVWRFCPRFHRLTISGPW